MIEEGGKERETEGTNRENHGTGVKRSSRVV